MFPSILNALIFLDFFSRKFFVSTFEERIIYGCSHFRPFSKRRFMIGEYVHHTGVLRTIPNEFGAYVNCLYTTLKTLFMIKCQ